MFAGHELSRKHIPGAGYRDDNIPPVMTLKKPFDGQVWV